MFDDILPALIDEQPYRDINLQMGFLNDKIERYNIRKELIMGTQAFGDMNEL
ncbi:hypothetical protein DPMN_075691 [Dreissena polymorpha]|uniref:Uncharacterized protein n=1 Tax=Dreissena polymorpha TaxID=45954 RepID=A0A9D4BPP3_DREPO|nr:hypothetical protein DPMN_075691 [Dreissena polymorpha]